MNDIIQQMQKQIAWLKVAVATCALLALLPWVMGQAPTKTLRATTSRHIVAEGISIVDKNGAVRGNLAVTEDGEVRFGLSDGKGKPHVVFSVDEDDHGTLFSSHGEVFSSGFWLWDKDRMRRGAWKVEDGNAKFQQLDKNGTPVAVLTAADEGPVLILKRGNSEALLAVFQDGKDGRAFLDLNKRVVFTSGVDGGYGVLNDKDGKARLNLSTVSLRFRDEDGKQRIGLGTSSQQNLDAPSKVDLASLWIRDKYGNPRISIMEDQGKPTIVITNANGKASFVAP